MSDHSKSSPLKTYFAVWAALLVGTFITYKAAYIELGRFNAAVALTIATVKALLVALFFMHLRRQRKTAEAGGNLHGLLPVHSVSPFHG